MPLTHSSAFSTTLQTDHARIKNMHFFNSERTDTLLPRGQQVNVSSVDLLLAASPRCKGSWDFSLKQWHSLYISLLIYLLINYKSRYPTVRMNINSQSLPQMFKSTRFNCKMSGDRPCKTCHHDARALWVVASTNYTPKFNTSSQGLFCLRKHHQWMSTSITVNSPSTVSTDACGQLCSEKTLNRFYRTEVTIHDRQRG